MINYDNRTMSGGVYSTNVDPKFWQEDFRESMFKLHPGRVPFQRNAAPFD